MARRVGVILSGCGHRDGAEISEAVFAMAALDRAGAEVMCFAPDVAQAVIANHLTGDATAAAKPKRGVPPERSVLAEAARIARGKIRPLAQLDAREVDALLFPGGEGVGQTLSNWAEKGEICDVDPDVARLLRACLAARKPMGFICLAPILAARVLGPVAGVRVTLGPRGTTAAKHAAVMGADVRPCPVDDILIDQKSRVVSTPAFMYDDARLSQVSAAIEKLVRTLLR
jgi:enhancing lycopene biosynthesis protein 2